MVAVSEMLLESRARSQVPMAGTWAHSGLRIKSSNCPSAFGSFSGSSSSLSTLHPILATKAHGHTKFSLVCSKP